MGLTEQCEIKGFYLLFKPGLCFELYILKQAILTFKHILLLGPKY